MEIKYIGISMTEVKSINQPVAVTTKLLEVELVANEKPFKKDDLVTRCGHDIHLVTELDDQCYFGEFKCIYDATGIYEVGESEGNISARYQKITKNIYPDLMKVIASRKLSRNT